MSIFIQKAATTESSGRAGHPVREGAEMAMILPSPAAAAMAVYLAETAIKRQLSGVDLKIEDPDCQLELGQSPCG